MANRFGFPDIEELDRQQRMGLLSQFEKYPGGIPSQTAPYFVSVDRSKVAVPETIRNAPIEVEVLDDPSKKITNLMQYFTGIGPNKRTGNEALRLAAQQEAERLQAANTRPVFDPSTIPDIYKGQGRFTGSPDVPVKMNTIPYQEQVPYQGTETTIPAYPNYMETPLQNITNNSIREGVTIANQKNVEADDRGFFDTLLGNINLEKIFATLARPEILQTGPNRQGIRGLTANILDANIGRVQDEKAAAIAQGVIDRESAIENERTRQFNVAERGRAATRAESIRQFEKTMDAGREKRENDLRIALIKNAKNTQTKGTNPSEKTLQDIRDYLDDDKFDAVLDNASSDQIAVITRQAGLLLANDINETLPTAIDKAIDIFLKPLASGTPSGPPPVDFSKTKQRNK